MCGIAGIVAPEASRYQRPLQAMTDALAHRGPDGQGQLGFGGCLLGHRRLAIVDLDGGRQPLTSPDRRLAVTFNGEIYGYEDLRRQLPDYPFRTRSDTEVILALYRRHGEGALARLPGMFAFALWDEERQTLFCGRDRFGEKPFYYAIGRGGELVFASEIKALLASGLVEARLDRAAVGQYLQRQCVEADRSIYAGIRALPPGHALDYRQGRLRLWRYWQPPPVENDLDPAEAVERLRELLGQAVRRQLVADVPVGAFLSGGLDSSTLCAVARDFDPHLRTFSFDFTGRHSEVEYARAVATAYGTRHTELASGDSLDLAGQLWRMQQVYDEPFGDTSNIPTYLLAREARRHVKVVLTGDGGDELFGGYSWYQPLAWMEREGRIGLWRWIGARLVNRLCDLARLPGAAARELRIMGLADGRHHQSPLAAHRQRLALLQPRDLEQLGLADSLPRQEAMTGSLDEVLRFDIDHYLVADILTKIDRAAMAHGLELRAPFLDVELASFCMALPWRLKLATGQDKIILRRAFQERWPAAIRRRSKQGFGAPLDQWFRDPGLRELERHHLLDPAAPIGQLLDPRGIRQVLGRGDPLQRWTLLVLGVWLAGRPAAEACRAQDRAA